MQKRPRPARKVAASQLPIDNEPSAWLDPHMLVTPQQFDSVKATLSEAASKPQPFRVVVHPQVSLLCDLHGHLSNAEVIGLLAGKWDADRKCIYVQAAFPCNATDRVDDDGSTDVEMDPTAELAARESIHKLGLVVVGWYHSHPTFRPDPSTTDIVNQYQYQQLFRDDMTGTEAFIGLIVSTFDASNSSPESVHQWFHVVPFSSPSRALEKQWLPMKIEVQNAVVVDTYLTQLNRDKRDAEGVYCLDAHLLTLPNADWGKTSTSGDQDKGNVVDCTHVSDGTTSRILPDDAMDRDGPKTVTAKGECGGASRPPVSSEDPAHYEHDTVIGDATADSRSSSKRGSCSCKEGKSYGDDDPISAPGLKETSTRRRKNHSPCPSTGADTTWQHPQPDNTQFIQTQAETNLRTPHRFNSSHGDFAADFLTSHLTSTSSGSYMTDTGPSSGHRSGSKRRKFGDISHESLYAMGGLQSRGTLSIGTSRDTSADVTTERSSRLPPLEKHAKSLRIESQEGLDASAMFNLERSETRLQSEARGNSSGKDPPLGEVPNESDPGEKERSAIGGCSAGVFAVAAEQGAPCIPHWSSGERLDEEGLRQQGALAGGTCLSDPSGGRLSATSDVNTLRNDMIIDSSKTCHSSCDMKGRSVGEQTYSVEPNNICMVAVQFHGKGGPRHANVGNVENSPSAARGAAAGNLQYRACTGDSGCSSRNPCVDGIRLGSDVNEGGDCPGRGGGECINSSAAARPAHVHTDAPMCVSKPYTSNISAAPVGATESSHSVYKPRDHISFLLEDFVIPSSVETTQSGVLHTSKPSHGVVDRTATKSVIEAKSEAPLPRKSTRGLVVKKWHDDTYHGSTRYTENFSDDDCSISSGRVGRRQRRRSSSSVRDEANAIDLLTSSPATVPSTANHLTTWSSGDPLSQSKSVKENSIVPVHTNHEECTRPPSPCSLPFSNLLYCLQQHTVSASKARRLICSVPSVLHCATMGMVALGFYYATSSRKTNLRRKWKGGLLKHNKIEASIKVWVKYFSLSQEDEGEFCSALISYLLSCWYQE